MSVLIINGSPRADGTVARILHIIEAEAEKRGCTASFIDVANSADSLRFVSCPLPLLRGTPPQRPPI